MKTLDNIITGFCQLVDTLFTGIILGFGIAAGIVLFLNIA